MNAWNSLLKFNIKSITFKKTYIIPTILLVIGTISIFIATNHTASHLTMVDMVSSDIKNNKQQKNIFIAKKEKIPKDLTARLASEENISKYYNQKKWSLAAKKYININNEDIQTSKEQHDPISFRSLTSLNIVMNYISKSNSFPNIDGLGIQGLNFLSDLLNIYFPEIIIVLLIFMITNLFTSKFNNQKNMDKILPKNSLFLENNRLISSILVSVFSYIVIILLAIIIATCVNGFGSLDYPIVLQLKTLGKTISIGELLIKMIFLQVLSIIFIISMIQLIANITKNQTLTLLITAGLSLLQSIAPFNFSFMYSILHFIPGTYFNSYQVLNNSITYSTNNLNINFDFGCFILITYSMLFIFANWIYNKKHKTSYN